MGQRAVLGLVAAVGALLTFAPGAASAGSLVVGDGGTGCPDARYATIQAAVDAARQGSQIVVCPGTYRESVTVGTPRLKIFSRKRHAAVVQVPDGPGGSTAFELSTGAVLVRGFTLLPSDESCDPGHFPDNAVEVHGNVTFDYNRIMGVGCRRFGDGVVGKFFPPGPGRLTVAHNEISGFAGIGVRTFRSASAINANAIRGGFGGILVEGGDPVVVQANTIEDVTGTAVAASGLDHGAFVIRIAGNRLRSNGYGISAQYLGEGQNFPVPAYARIEGNGVLDSVGDGIAIDFAPGLVYRNRSLGSGGFDCVERGRHRDNPTTWRDNIGVTDSPSNLCRAP